MPGDNIKMNVTLIAPIAMEEGLCALRFAKAVVRWVLVLSPKLLSNAH